MWTGNFATILKVRYSKDGVCYTTSHILVECFLTSQSHTFSQLKDESQNDPPSWHGKSSREVHRPKMQYLYSQGSIDGMHFRPQRTGIHFFRLREIRSAAKIRGFSTTLRIIGPSKVASFWGPKTPLRTLQVHSPETIGSGPKPILREKKQNKTPSETRSIFHFRFHDAQKWPQPLDLPHLISRWDSPFQHLKMNSQVLEPYIPTFKIPTNSMCFFTSKFFT